jgi:hypothetical protein
MTKQDRQKLSILVVLLAVLSVTIAFGYRLNQPQTTSAVQTPEPKPSANPPATGDARILLELVEKPDAAEGDIGKKNLFQYQQASQPPAPPRGGPPLSANPAPSQAQVPTPITRGPQPPPPPAPSIPLKYQGFAATTNPTRGLTAFLSDDSRHYNVIVGEVLMGRYRIASITDKSVEVEDLESNRRQTLPLLK